MSLPSDAKERKAIPIFSGFIAYFPDAIAEVAKQSVLGNDQHSPGLSVRWDRAKSGDEVDALARHLTELAGAQTVDEKILAARCVAWRSMANLQKLCERRELEEDANHAAMAAALARTTADALCSTDRRMPTPGEMQEYIDKLNN